jgi:hypothetical protein
VGKVLADVADDAETIGDGIEVDAERHPHQRNRQRVDEHCLTGCRVNCVDTAAVPYAVEFAVLHPEVDADERGVVSGQTLHVANVSASPR